MEFLTYFVMFWIGWLCSSVWSFIFNLGTTAVMMQNITFAICCFMKLMHENTTEFLKIKYDKLDKMGISENDIKLMTIQDKQTVEGTQKVLLELMLKKFPQGFNHLIKFDSWRGMLLYIQENQGDNDA